MSNLGDSGPSGEVYPKGYLATLVHELRTPLTALRGSLGLLSSVVDDASPEAKSFAVIAERNASRLAEMLDDLAELERIRGGNIVAQPERVDLADVIDDVVFGEQSFAEQAKVEIRVEAGAADVLADSALLKNLMSRVLRYAIQMSSPGQPVNVRTAQRDGVWIVEIVDHGKPVPEGARASIFDCFSLVARRGTDTSARPGLNLALARALADLLGATLTFTSTDAGGTFRLELPGFGTRDSGFDSR